MNEMKMLYKEGERYGPGPFVFTRKWIGNDVIDIIIEWGVNDNDINPATMTRKTIYYAIEAYNGIGIVEADIIRKSIHLYDKMMVLCDETRQD